ncbi:MAG: polyphosphate:nucleotide phosphotransferase, family [Rhodospirillales bacterium]|nr:polyphosphate:nucleotide phosphotransferase, family [Rhodospirillales bacterium]
MLIVFPKLDLGALERYRVRPATGSLNLAKIDPRDETGFATTKEGTKAAMLTDIVEIERLQDILYAEAKRAVLVILQGMDTSGKDSAIRKVFGPLPPLGVVTTNFKKPSPQELAHDYLWRVHKAVPPVRMFGLFNRSHYEDVLAPRVHGSLPGDRIEARYGQINAFEQHLAENDVTILKFFLHITKEEQARRLQDRLTDPTKQWKLNPDDLKERERWDDYMAAYEIAIKRCSLEWAPWFIVPAERRWYRNAVIARITRRAFEALDLSYPPIAPGLDKIEIK